MLAPTAALHNLLSLSAARQGKAVAIVEPGGRCTTYAALDEYSSRVAHELDRVGLGGGVFVALLVPKGVDAVAAMFGILRSGNAYIPLSLDIPTTRLVDIILDARPGALIAGAEEARVLAESPLEGWSFASMMGEGLALFLPREKGHDAGEGAAYCLYTSGSSGKPKGVVHSHASAGAFIDWCSAEFAIDQSDRFSSIAPFNFDLSIFDIFVPVKHGATIVVFGEHDIRKPVHLARELQRLAVTVVYATPTLFRLLIGYGDMKAGYSPGLLCFAGEIFPTNQLRQLMQLWPSAKYYNLYGPTETNVCSYHPVTEADLDKDQVPIGRACSGDTLMLSPLTHGQTGELLVTGPSVMMRYCNVASSENSVFTQYDGRRWYRTGDIVEEIEPGKFRYVGRRDRMVKRRGYRIELNEIELALARDDRLSEIAVVSGTSDDGADLIVCCFFCACEKVSTLQLRKQLAGLLPLYMMPDKILQIDSLPKTATDKVDYLRLKELAHAQAVQ